MRKSWNKMYLPEADETVAPEDRALRVETIRAVSGASSTIKTTLGLSRLPFAINGGRKRAGEMQVVSIVH